MRWRHGVMWSIMRQQAIFDRLPIPSRAQAVTLADMRSAGAAAMQQARQGPHNAYNGV